MLELINVWVIFTTISRDFSEHKTKHKAKLKLPCHFPIDSCTEQTVKSNWNELTFALLKTTTTRNIRTKEKEKLLQLKCAAEKVHEEKEKSINGHKNAAQLWRAAGLALNLFSFHGKEISQSFLAPYFTFSFILSFFIDKSDFIGSQTRAQLSAACAIQNSDWHESLTVAIARRDSSEVSCLISSYRERLTRKWRFLLRNTEWINFMKDLNL